METGCRVEAGYRVTAGCRVKAGCTVEAGLETHTFRYISKTVKSMISVFVRRPGRYVMTDECVAGSHEFYYCLYVLCLHA